MPSFAYEVKNELVRVIERRDCCLHSELNALLQIGATINDNKIDFINSNAAVARKVLILAKKIYPGINTEVSVIRTKKLRRINRYGVRIFLTPQTEELFNMIKKNEIPIPIPRQTCCCFAYLRGAFLAGGTISKPESDYHFEVSTTKDIAQLIVRLMKKMDFPVNMFERKSDFVVYMKEFDSIVDLLYFIKAEKAVENFEVARNLKDVRVQVNRVVNCETANLQRAVNAAQRQIAAIEAINDHGIELPEILQKTAEARLQNPELPMTELASMLFLTPSGLKCRMRRLYDLAKPWVKQETLSPCRKKKNSKRKHQKKVTI